MVWTRSPVILPLASSASSACVTWSRPCASERNASVRSAVHLTGRSIFFAAQSADGLLGVDENLRAEAAADVGRDDAQLIFGRETDEGRQHEPRDMRVLARRIERDRVRAGIVVADGGARLHRVRDQAVVDEIELCHMLRRGEGRVGRRLVAEVPVVDRVVRRDVMDLRLAGLGGAVAMSTTAGSTP